MKKTIIDNKTIQNNVKNIIEQIDTATLKATYMGDKMLMNFWINSLGNISLLEKDGTNGMFEIMTDIEKDKVKYRIIAYIGDFIEIIKHILDETVTLFNSKHAFIPKNFEKIIKENIELMRDSKKGMHHKIGAESMGGNAGEGRVATNFQYDSNGKIIIFENFQHIDKKILSKTKRACFHIEMNANRLKIVEKINKKILNKNPNISQEDFWILFKKEVKKENFKEYKIINVYFDSTPSVVERSIITATLEYYNKHYGW